MKAIIMAGGEGTRLRPLTCSLPKPLVPLLNKPTMAYTVDLLRRAGIYDIGVTLAFEPQKIVREFGASLRYFVEDKPLGTAGSVRAARDFLTETFVVISGDALTDVDLNQAIAFHRRRGAMATMVLCHADDPQPYGGVLIERDGRVKHFIEKPDWAGVASDLVNTGIYILEPEVLDLIPEGKYDFGRELFPAMVQQGKPLYGHVMQGYWCDIGDIGAYLGAQWDLLRGRVARPSGQRQLPDTRMGTDVRLESPCCIGRGCVIGDGAQILAGTVIGDCVYIGPGAVIERSVLWDGASVGAGAHLTGCVITDGVQIGRGVNVGVRAVVGSGCVVGENAVIADGVRIWPGHQVEDGAAVYANLRWAPKRAFACDRSRVSGVFLPEDLCAIGAAFSQSLQIRKLCAGYGADPHALLPVQAFLAGAASVGVQPVLSSAQAAATVFCAAQEGADAAACFSIQDGRIAMDLFYHNQRLSPAQAEKIRQALAAMDFPRVPYDHISAPLLRDQAQRAYELWKQSIDGGVSEFYGDVDENGGLTLYDPDGRALSPAVSETLIRRAVSYHSGEGDGLMRTLSYLDPSLALLLLGSYLDKTARTLGELLLECGAALDEVSIPCENRLKGTAMRRFLTHARENGQEYTLGADGVTVRVGGASARLAPRQNSAAIGVQVRALSEEFASELMVDTRKVLEQIVADLQKQS